MEVTFSKIAALVVAIGYIVATLALAPQGFLIVIGGLLFCLALIWFPDYLADRGLFGWNHGGTRDSPSGFIAFMGWIFLVGFPLVVFWTSHK